MLKDGQTYRLISDHLGSVRLVINSSTGTVAQRLDYDEYGNVLNDSNPGFQPFAYAGGLYDVDTGLVRFGARDYDATAGRWLQSDPIGVLGNYSGTNHLYSYVDQNPINWYDPEGLSKTNGKNANKSKPMNVGDFNKNSSAASVKAELNNMKSQGKSKTEHYKNLKGLLKVIKKGKNGLLMFIPTPKEAYCQLNPYNCFPAPPEC